MIIDIFTHFFPAAYFRALTSRTSGLGAVAERLNAVAPLSNLDARFAAMDALPDYRQVICLPTPPAEDVTSAVTGTEICRIGNDALAELVTAHPDRFAAFVASVSLLDVEGAVEEIDRAVTHLGARGVQIYTNVAGRPLDLPDFAPVFDAMARHDLPVFLHPARTAAMTDYAAEPKSRYEMWWCLGWPYETSVAMARLVFSGLFDRHPGLKIVTHHMGAMIPAMDGRLDGGMRFLGSRTPDEDYSAVLPSLKRPHADYFRDFYADTALFGGTSGLLAGLDFFGLDHVVFATDAPFAPLRETYDALSVLNLSDVDRGRILHGNAQRLLRLSGA
jgi:aminocarboxymuconate-semialdehyde decarboxylase